MLVLTIDFFLKPALYGFLAYAALIVANAEEHAGRRQLCHHHRAAALVYMLLAAIHVLHI
jgi:hypothetical protein